MSLFLWALLITGGMLLLTLPIFIWAGLDQNFPREPAFTSIPIFPRIKQTFIVFHLVLFLSSILWNNSNETCASSNFIIISLVTIGFLSTAIYFHILILCLYLLQTHFGISSFSHPDNALEVCGLLTPLHIVPEWYFLCQYAMLKAVPNKNAGFIILLTSIFTFFFIGEIRNLTTFTRFETDNNGFSISSFFLSLLSCL